jgi:ferredoxin, 2Fe-2S
MIRLLVTRRNGVVQEVLGPEGSSVMQVLRHGGIDELLALCGGSRACATCHVYVESDYLPRLPSISKDEDELLSCSDHRTERSRLSCQLKCAPALDGMHVDVAPEN